ncbi:ABC transporter ATP-binding protein [Haladaptatus cibarius]|uniref:ABC transporter ATP-binding protein n=1 Tax=Haladaptatus cibarius TaxID=453847 RepID=UPI000A0127AF|nr:oligopeptide/dipeptide ABC transporter ATP-binding protein [Haladaptatus cibarius]
MSDHSENSKMKSDESSSDEQALLSVRGLKQQYPVTEGPLRREVGTIHAVDGIDFDVHRGETLGLIGESGSGKSTAATALLHLEDPTAGTVRFDGNEIGEYDRTEQKVFRRRAQRVFQDPTTSFDPRMTVGESVAEPLSIHGMTDADQRRAITEDILPRVGLSAEQADRYPHELSGGQKQRAALARALILNPDLLVLDEPVSGLDVSVQAEILTLLSDLQSEFDLSLLLITHDMGVVREVADRVAVMYLGEIVERGATEALFRKPQHPYTQALVSVIPTPDPDAKQRRVTLRGDVPDAASPPSGCRFHPRCPAVIPPENYDFEQDEWRSVMDLRVAVSDDDVDLDSLRTLVVAREEAETADAVSAEQLQSAIREEYEIPANLSDEDAETVLASALSDIVSGDVAGADERLQSEFSTICERENPREQSTDAGHPAACHLHEIEETDEEWNWVSVD